MCGGGFKVRRLFAKTGSGHIRIYIRIHIYYIRAAYRAVKRESPTKRDAIILFIHSQAASRLEALDGRKVELEAELAALHLQPRPSAQTAAAEAAVRTLRTLHKLCVCCACCVHAVVHLLCVLRRALRYCAVLRHGVLRCAMVCLLGCVALCCHALRGGCDNWRTR